MFARLAAVTFALATVGAVPALAGEIESSVDPGSLTKREHTALGLYVTSADAHRALEADPSIVFVDVRTRAEFAYVGHPDSVDQNIPSKFLTGDFNPKSGSYAYDVNTNFVADMDALMAREGKGRDDPVFVICRSGGRSAVAVNRLAKAGYRNVYNVVDGFEGGKDKQTGHRTIEGWRNAGLPWGYRISAAMAYAAAE